jgi:hypothetical protein
MYTKDKTPINYGTYTKTFWSSWQCDIFQNIPQNTWPVDFSGSLDLPIAAHTQFLCFFFFFFPPHIGRGSEALYLVSILSADPGCDLFLGLRTLPTKLSTISPKPISKGGN